jgi:hypothetical protein
VIPFAAIAFMVLGDVYLAVSRDVVQQEYARLPHDALQHGDVPEAPDATTVDVAVVEEQA